MNRNNRFCTSIWSAHAAALVFSMTFTFRMYLSMQCCNSLNSLSILETSHITYHAIFISSYVEKNKVFGNKWGRQKSVFRNKASCSAMVPWGISQPLWNKELWESYHLEISYSIFGILFNHVNIHWLNAHDSQSESWLNIGQICVSQVDHKRLRLWVIADDGGW